MGLPSLASCACFWAVWAYCLFEGLATNKAAAEDADATFDDTALALDVATGFPATRAPEDWAMDAEMDPDGIVPLLPVMVPVLDEAVLDSTEAETLVLSVPVADEVVTERLEADDLVPMVDPWVTDADIDENVPVKEVTPPVAEDAVADGESKVTDADPDDRVPVKEESADAEADVKVPLKMEPLALGDDTVADEMPTEEVEPDPAVAEEALPLLDEI